MKKPAFALLIALLTLTLLQALPAAASSSDGFCDTPPDSLLAAIRADYEVLPLLDVISFSLPSGVTDVFMMDDYGRMHEYRYWDSAWSMCSDFSPTRNRWQSRFVRHDTSTPRADGATYPDALGFDLVDENTQNRISYHHNGTEFVLCGWKNPSEYDGEVILNGQNVAYYKSRQAEPEAQYQLSERIDYLLAEFEELPATPAAAKALADITREAVENLYPGYTMRNYYSSGWDSNASAYYSRIQNGVLHVRRVYFSTDMSEPVVTDCVPVPLCAELLSRLETESFNDLLYIGESSDLFLTDAAYNTAKIPVTGKIINSDLQENALLLLTEDEKAERRLSIVTYDETGYNVRSTLPLPAGASLDTFHTSDGAVLFQWTVLKDGDEQYRSASYSQMADGVWQLSWVMNSGEDGLDYSAVYCGVRYEWSGGSTDGIFISTLPNQELLSADISALPRTQAELSAALSRDGWAVVHNDDPADRLHLRTEPNRSAKSLGKFYNGTPVHVLDEKGDWCQVEIGLDGHLTGWMMKRYLAFGAAMDAVKCAFPMLVLREEYVNAPMYADMELRKQRTTVDEWIVGVVEDELFILLSTSGDTAYAPQAWFWEGNG